QTCQHHVCDTRTAAPHRGLFDERHLTPANAIYRNPGRRHHVVTSAWPRTVAVDRAECRRVPNDTRYHCRRAPVRLPLPPVRRGVRSARSATTRSRMSVVRQRRPRTPPVELLVLRPIGRP